VTDTASSSLTHIVVRGAREHNLRDLDVRIPRDELVVITGLSGSGKSSLAFDTIYAEGQRRYVESLSAYARQFLEQMSKPDVDSIDGLSPAIAIEQKSVSRNPRSTVGTITEIADYLRLLYARVGQPHCHRCGKPIASQTVQQMTDRVLELGPETRVQILAPVVRDRKGEYRRELESFRRQGFVRARIDGALHDLSEEIRLSKQTKHSIDVVVDRLVAKGSTRGRIAESIETALRLSEGLVTVSVARPRGSARPKAAQRGEAERRSDESEEWLLSERNACVDCGVSYPEISPRMFSFNSPHGACLRCGGLGTRDEFDPELVVPDDTKSLAGGAIAPWSGRRAARYYGQVIRALAAHYEIDADTPWRKLPGRARSGILHGAGRDEIEFAFERRGRQTSFKRRWDGVIGEMDRRYESGNEADHAELAHFRSAGSCPDCDGSRLRVEARSVRVGGRSITDVSRLTIADAASFVDELDLAPAQRTVADRILKEIRDRLRFLVDVGLSYAPAPPSRAARASASAWRPRWARA
jgi:excinuclease ABC subunit A